MKTESVKYDPSSYATAPPTTSSSYPFVATESRTVGGASQEEVVKGPPVVTTLMDHGDIITTQSITSKTRTVETVTVIIYSRVMTSFASFLRINI